MKLFKIENKNQKKVLHILGLKVSLVKKTSKKINFRTFEQLSLTIRKNIHILPNDIDLVVGIPRSGMIPAYIIALFMNKKVCSLTEFINGITPKNGERKIANNKENKKILFVDDSIASGNALSKTKQLLQSKFSAKEMENFLFMAVFALKESKKLVDFYFEIVNQPRLFQWNYLNHTISSKCCFDLDGVLCVDPTEEQNDDGEEYKKFILSARPLFIPQYEINAIVTSRLEKYRQETETWLKNNNVKYKKLYMLNLKSAAERREKNCHADFKAHVYKKLKDTICFIESDPKQAEKIAKLSKKQCICVSTDEFFE